MLHTTRYTAGALTACLTLLAGCVDYDDATRPITVSVQLVAPADFTAPADLGGKTVDLLCGGQTLTATTDATGRATFAHLTPDVYDISTSWTLSADDYATATGSREAVAGATVAGALNARFLSADEVVALPTLASPDRDIVIGKVYYAGSRNDNNRTYIYGKYIELYNQSTHDIDVSGLYIGITEAESTQAWTLDAIGQRYGQDSVVMLKQIYRIPAGEPRTVEPGGTIVICNSAIDHTVNNAMDHDLSDADYEMKDSQSRYTNNPATPALEMIYQIYAGTTVINMLQSGPVGVVIFRTDDDLAQWERVYAYGKTSGNQWVVCPTRCVIDGMEALANKASGIDVATKRLWSSIDAGYTYINAASGWNGETVYRKTLKTQDGHKVLTDTNNSSNDFKASTTIQPRRYDD